LVEFQRRQGDRVAFAKMFDAFSELSGRPVRRVSGDETDGLANILDEEGVSMVLDMAASQFYECQRDALQALSSYAVSPANREIIMAASGSPTSLVKLFSSGLASSDHELSNYAARLLWRFSLDESMHEAIATFVLNDPTSTQILAAPYTYLNADTKRSVAAAVSNIAQTMSSNLAKSKVLEKIERLSRSQKDVRLQASALKAMQLVSQK